MLSIYPRGRGLAPATGLTSLLAATLAVASCSENSTSAQGPVSVADASGSSGGGSGGGGGSSSGSTPVTEDASVTPPPDATTPPAEDGAPEANSPSTDSGENADASGDAQAPCVFCEDFETGQIDPNKWTQYTSTGQTIEIEGQIVAHGKYAMHVQGQSGPSDYALLVTKSAPAALHGTSSFGRVYFYTAPMLTSGHTSMVFAGNVGTGPATGPSPFPKLRYMEVANIHAGWQLGFDLLDISPLVEMVAYPSSKVTVSAWQCLEWDFEDQPDHITMWVNGTQIGTFDNTDIAYSSTGSIPQPGTPIYNGMNSGIIGGFDTFGVGFHDWHPAQPFDLYYDDFVLDTKRIGCLPP
jgi:hypothetical protein